MEERPKNYLQLLIKTFFEQLRKIDRNTKVVHYFDNSKGHFFFQGQNFKGLAENKVQNFLTTRGRHLSALGCGFSTFELLCDKMYMHSAIKSTKKFNLDT